MVKCWNTLDTLSPVLVGTASSRVRWVRNTPNLQDCMHATATRVHLGPELASVVHVTSTAMYPRHFDGQSPALIRTMRGMMRVGAADYGADPALRVACCDLQGWYASTRMIPHAFMTLGQDRTDFIPSPSINSCLLPVSATSCTLG